MTLNYLGSPDATIVLYLPSPPLLPSDFVDTATKSARIHPESGLTIAQLIELNGNHWRKILTILAKLCSPQDDWRGYRDRQLLQQHEAICFESALRTGLQIQLVAGKASWQRLGLDLSDFTALDSAQRLWRSNQYPQLFLTPYFDYRQFPNVLIEQLKSQLNSQLKP
ncbi:MAG: hypothetical protein V7707_17035 [Motiliproteus sp.]